MALRHMAVACPLAVFAPGDGPVPQQGTAALRMPYPEGHQTCSVAGQIVNILGFAGCIVFAAVTQLHQYSVVIDKT